MSNVAIFDLFLYALSDCSFVLYNCLFVFYNCSFVLYYCSLILYNCSFALYNYTIMQISNYTIQFRFCKSYKQQTNIYFFLLFSILSVVLKRTFNRYISRTERIKEVLFNAIGNVKVKDEELTCCVLGKDMMITSALSHGMASSVLYMI